MRIIVPSNSTNNEQEIVGNFSNDNNLKEEKSEHKELKSNKKVVIEGNLEEILKNQTGLQIKKMLPDGKTCFKFIFLV